MDLKNGIKNRRSIRKFKDMKISHEILEEIADTAKYAPSWKNTKTARYFFVESDDIKKKLSDECVFGMAHNGGIIDNCAVVAVLAYVTGRSGFEKDGSFTTSKGDRWEMFDAGISAQTFCLSAYEKGIGTCIMGIFDEDKVAETINLPEGMKVAALIAMGYPDENPDAPARKDTKDIISFI